MGYNQPDGSERWATTGWRIWSSSGRDCMTSWPRPATSGEARSARTIAAAAPELCVRATGSPRPRPPVPVDAHRGRPWHHGAAAVGRRGGQGAWRAGQLPPLRRGGLADRGGERGDLCGAPTQPGGHGAPGRNDGGRKGAPRPDRRGVRGRGRAAGRAGGRLAGLRRGRGAGGAGDPHRDDPARRRVAAAIGGHRYRAPRAADRLRQGASGRVCRLPRQAGRHRAGPDQRVPCLVSLRPNADTGSRPATTISVSPARRCRRACAR